MDRRTGNPPGGGAQHIVSTTNQRMPQSIDMSSDTYKNTADVILRSRGGENQTNDDAAYIAGAKRVLKFMYECWVNNRLCDLILNVGGGQQFYAHKIVICAYSNALHEECNRIPKGNVVALDLPDFSKEIVVEMLYFVYTTQIEIHEGNIRGLIRLSIELDMDVLLHLCQNDLKNFTLKNLFTYYDIAQEIGMNGVMSAIQDYVRNHLLEVFSSDGFLTISFERINGILSESRPSNVPELEVFSAIVRWIEYDKPSRLPFAPPLMEYVRFSQIDPDALVNRVEIHSDIFQIRQCQQLLYDAMKYHALNSGTGGQRALPPQGGAASSSAQRTGGSPTQQNSAGRAMGNVNGNRPPTDFNNSNMQFMFDNKNMVLPSQQQHQKYTSNRNYRPPLRTYTNGPQMSAQPGVYPSTNNTMLRPPNSGASPTSLGLSANNNVLPPYFSNLSTGGMTSTICSSFGAPSVDTSAPNYYSTMRDYTATRSAGLMAAPPSNVLQPPPKPNVFANSQLPPHFNQNVTPGTKDQRNTIPDMFGGRQGEPHSRTDKIRDQTDGVVKNSTSANPQTPNSQLPWHLEGSGNTGRYQPNSADRTNQRQPNSADRMNPSQQGQNKYNTNPSLDSILMSHLERKKPSVIAIGGIDITSNFMDYPGRCLYKYNDVTNTWSLLTMMNLYIHHHTSAVIDNKVYVIGGIMPDLIKPNDPGHATDQVKMYDCECEAWIHIAPMLQCRAYISAAVYKNCIYVAGGENENKMKLSTIEQYNANFDKWTVIGNMQGGAKIGTATCVYNHCLYIVGGYNNGPVLPDVECFDLISRSWIRKKPLSTPRCHANLVVANGKMYLIGGRTQSRDGMAAMSSIAMYNDETDSFVNVTDMNIPRLDCGCTVDGSKIYIMGGIHTPNPECLNLVEVYDTNNKTWASNVAELPHPSGGLSCVTAV